jgi:hypothetical protein
MKQYNGEKVIISLTSWKARITAVAKTLYSLIKQSLNCHIVLTLCTEEFPNKEQDLPNTLRLFAENNLIEILWCDKNIKSHKKYVHVFKKYEYTRVPIILADDDLLYKKDFANTLYTAHKLNLHCIIASRCHYVMFDSNHKVLPYRQWEYETKKQSGKFLFFTSGARYINSIRFITQF